MSYESTRTLGRHLEDGGSYDLSKGEMNPRIFEEFASLVSVCGKAPVIWEPFAGHMGRSRAQDTAEKLGVSLVSFDISPSDPRVVKADSTIAGPCMEVNGVLFHPPYFGSAQFSSESGELATCLDRKEYMGGLMKAASIAKGCLAEGGMVCAVGRDYRFGGERVRLDRWLLELFDVEMRVPLMDVWKSEPDVALIFGRDDES